MSSKPQSLTQQFAQFYAMMVFLFFAVFLVSSHFLLPDKDWDSASQALRIILIDLSKLPLNQWKTVAEETYFPFFLALQRLTICIGLAQIFCVPGAFWYDIKMLRGERTGGALGDASQPVSLLNRRTVSWAIGMFVWLQLMAVGLGRLGTPRVARIVINFTLFNMLLAIPLLWLWHRATSPGRPGEGLSDIREAYASQAQLQSYKPEQYLDADKGLFVGLEGEQPVYLNWNAFRSTHMQIVGTTGSGKGVASSLILAQCALAQETVVIFDPKEDEYAPKVMSLAAERAKVPIYLLDLRPSAPPQFNILKHARRDEVDELLTTAFDLGEKGNNADFYRLADRNAARDVAYRADENPSMPQLWKRAQTSSAINTEKGNEKAIKFRADLEELTSLPVTNTTEGLDLHEVLDKPGVLYIIGSVRNQRTIRLQKMLLLRIMQIIEARNRDTKPRYIAIMLDELKYLLSQPALQALGTVRDKYCHVLLAHQSLADLRDCGGLDPKAVTGAVVENTSVKLIYRANSPETAEWASGLSGTMVNYTQNMHMKQKMFMAQEGQYMEKERAYFHINDLLALPKGTGMLFGHGLSKKVQVAHLETGTKPLVVPVEAAVADVMVSAEAMQITVAPAPVTQLQQPLQIAPAFADSSNDPQEQGPTTGRPIQSADEDESAAMMIADSTDQVM